MRPLTKSRKRFLPRLADLEDRLAPATFTVTSSADSGAGTLREAVGFANTLGGADVIDFKAGLGTITLTTGQLSISDAVAIEGPATGTLTISGNNVSRIFDTSPAPAGAAISFARLTLVNGNGAGGGGAVLGVGESLTLSDCNLTLNTCAGFGFGGGVSITGGSLTLIRCMVTANSAGFNGGGVDASGAVVSLIDCTIANNKASNSGGGLGIESSSLTILGSTISGNTASVANGGGLYFADAVGVNGLNVRNSTISGNSCAVSGGAIGLFNFTGTLTVQNSTVTLNICGLTGSGSGGGIARLIGTGDITLTSSVVAGNVANTTTSEDLFSKGKVSAFACAIGTTIGAVDFDGDATTDALLGQNFKLGGLAANGGLTQTHLPASVSPILNLGSNPVGLPTDQRGSPFVRSFGAGVDIGAVEVQNAFVVTTNSDSGSGSLREAVTAANGNSGADLITFDAGLFATPQTITLTNGLISISQALTIQGPGAKLVTISGNNTGFGIITTTPTPTGTALFFSGLTFSGSKNASAVQTGEEVLTFSNCVFSGNTSDIIGGAVEGNFFGSLVFDNCSFIGNKAQTGGAILALGDLTVTNCTFSQNVASHSGGAFEFQGNGSLTVRNCTISGNSSGLISGGGIALGSFTGIAMISNSTITLNSSPKGGGIAKFGFGTAAIFVESCIVSGNTASTGPEIYSTVAISTAASILSSASGISTFIADGATLALLGKSPSLGPLQDNGGPTLTHLPAFGSPAINAGLNPAPPLSTDQRGLPRSFGVIDIGSVEVQTASPVVTGYIVNGGNPNRSRLTTITVNFASPVEAATLQAVGAVTLTRTAATGSGTVGTVVNTSNGLIVSPAADPVSSVTLTFANVVNAGVENGSLADGRWRLAIPTSNYLSALNDSTLRRLYGDGNADGTVDGNDLAAFGAVFGATGPSTFTYDFNDDGTIDAVDFGEFGNRFGVTL